MSDVLCWKRSFRMLSKDPEKRLTALELLDEFSKVNLKEKSFKEFPINPFRLKLNRITHQN